MTPADAPTQEAPRSSDRRSFRDRLLDGLVWSYGLVLVAVLVTRYGLGDRTWWSFAANALLLYAFLPAPLILAVVALRRRREGVVIVVLSALLFVWLWGGLFVPCGKTPQATENQLRIMSYNTLGFNPNTAATIRVIREVNADIVALQEMTPEHADALEQALSERYPYRLLDARPGVTGSGILSRHPLRKVDASPLDRIAWIGTPMVVELDIGTERVTFVNFHTVAGPANARVRDEQARALADFADAHAGPLIFAGDLNATDQNAAHAIVTRAMRDAWREAGWGFGHTFPGEPTPARGGSRPVLLGVPVPTWLVRIDYIFHSNALETIDARIGPGDGGSDHRPVVATLSFVTK
ncbi:endonuclease/exonuclease/phosphatase family protein [Polyangium jinanense]|uniref:Endonuclease/exonuclease/phosphatase family protein n=1 Tax=Polyangium jinanense TaxID=2829994 RepID=A0A9X3XCJ7_9BACT|nr:endonuclease/exonuclease/phosphatase family protein [Polyangium jinanense]MDC3957418.1 endonuclease/exonuclease/phosphatase family protein [Polyangium jinanense]MDC3988194.1 endonuclease/exonuclease/phosphatase family protein [Polyangium jinanense]